MRIEKLSLIAILLLMIVTSCATRNNITLKGDPEVNGFYELDDNGKEFEVLGNSDLKFKLKNIPSVKSDRIDRLEIDMEANQAGWTSINVFFTEKGKSEFANFTRKNMNKQIFYVVNGVIITFPKVMGVIDGGRTQYVVNDKYLDSLFLIP